MGDCGGDLEGSCDFVEKAKAGTESDEALARAQVDKEYYYGAFAKA